jgi:hypothetical protein
MIRVMLIEGGVQLMICARLLAVTNHIVPASQWIRMESAVVDRPIMNRTGLNPTVLDTSEVLLGPTKVLDRATQMLCAQVLRTAKVLHASHVSAIDVPAAESAVMPPAEATHVASANMASPHVPAAHVPAASPMPMACTNARRAGEDDT